MTATAPRWPKSLSSWEMPLNGRAWELKGYVLVAIECWPFASHFTIFVPNTASSTNLCRHYVKTNSFEQPSPQLWWYSKETTHSDASFSLKCCFSFNGRECYSPREILKRYSPGRAIHLAFLNVKFSSYFIATVAKARFLRVSCVLKKPQTLLSFLKEQVYQRLRNLQELKGYWICKVVNTSAKQLKHGITFTVSVFLGR